MHLPRNSRKRACCDVPKSISYDVLLRTTLIKKNHYLTYLTISRVWKLGKNIFLQEVSPIVKPLGTLSSRISSWRSSFPKNSLTTRSTGLFLFLQRFQGDKVSKILALLQAELRNRLHAVRGPDHRKTVNIKHCLQNSRFGFWCQDLMTRFQIATLMTIWPRDLEGLRPSPRSTFGCVGDCCSVDTWRWKKNSGIMELETISSVRFDEWCEGVWSNSSGRLNFLARWSASCWRLMRSDYLAENGSSLQGEHGWCLTLQSHWNSPGRHLASYIKLLSFLKAFLAMLMFSHRYPIDNSSAYRLATFSIRNSQ